MGTKYELIANDDCLGIDRTVYDSFDLAKANMDKAYHAFCKEKTCVASDLQGETAYVQLEGGHMYSWSIWPCHENNTDDFLEGISVPKDMIQRAVTAHEGRNGLIAECTQSFIDMQRYLCSIPIGDENKDDITKGAAKCIISIATIMKVLDIDPDDVQKCISDCIENN